MDADCGLRCFLDGLSKRQGCDRDFRMQQIDFKLVGFLSRSSVVGNQAHRLACDKKTSYKFGHLRLTEKALQAASKVVRHCIVS